MFKKFAAIAMGGGCLLAVALCLGLLPVTALAAAAPDRQVIYVGNENVTSGGYWTTDSNGSVTAYTEDGTTPSNNYIHYNKETNTLTLHNATIKESLDYTDSNGDSSLIHSSAIGVLNQQGNAELTIQLEGSNTIAEVSQGIYVLAHSQSTGSSSLTITGNGSLDTSGSQFCIRVQSNSSDAALSIENAKVTATVVDGYGGNGVFVQSSENSSVSLTVNSGSLTATGSGEIYAGIKLQFGSGGSGSGTPTVTVSNNAIVRANGSAGGITSNSSAEVQTAAGTGESGGIVFDGKTGTVYGDVTLDESLTISDDETLTIPEGATLTTNDNLTNNGTIINKGTLTGTSAGIGTTETAPAITAQPIGQTVIEGETATFAIEAIGGNLSYQWQKSNDDGQSWVNIDGANAATYTTEAATTAMNGCRYRCAVGNSVGNIISGEAILSVHVHAWGEPEWSWSADGKNCTVTFTCEGDATHQETPEVEVTSAVKTPATCTEAGVTTYTATVEFDGKTYTSTKDVADIPAAGHKLTKTEAKAPTCTEPGSAEYWTCGVCDKVFSDAAGDHEITLEDAAIPATGHESEGGLCSVCGARDTSFLPALVSGDGARWTKGSSKGLTFVSSAAFADLVEVRLDGRVLSASEYAIREGSTVVTLPAKLLEGLKAGDHELLIVSGSGTVRASLTVAEAAKVEEALKAEKASANELPANGDSTAPALAISAAAVAGAGLVILSRRRAAR